MHFFVNMKKRYKFLIAAIIVLVFLFVVYFFMTADGALRLGVLMEGYPRKAVLMDYIGMGVDKNDADVTHYAIDDPPYDAKRDTYEENWTVTKYGMFYVAHCTD